MRQGFIRTSNLIQSINASRPGGKNEVEGDAVEKTEEKKPKEGGEEAKHTGPEDEVFKKKRRYKKAKKSVVPFGTTDKLHCSS